MYQYWLLRYISCEGNNRWTIIRSLDLHKDDIITMIPLGGCGDDISDILSIDETSDNNYSIDLT